jgi:hypothetical protein
VREIADKNFQLLKSDPKHPSLHLKRIEKVWPLRVGKHHRALGPGHLSPTPYLAQTHKLPFFTFFLFPFAPFATTLLI